MAPPFGYGSQRSEWPPGRLPHKAHVDVRIPACFLQAKVLYSASDPMSGHAHFVWQGDDTMEWLTEVKYYL